jgi:hypothetical protein
MASNLKNLFLTLLVLILYVFRSKACLIVAQKLSIGKRLVVAFL